VGFPPFPRLCPNRVSEVATSSARDGIDLG